jgi:diguanylate cyclase (GGDEF)-like protein
MRISDPVSGSLVPAQRHSPLVIRSCWIQIGIATFLYLVALRVDSHGPALGMRWHSSGSISEILPGGPAARAGLAPADQLIAIDGVPIASGNPVLYQVRAGTPVTIVVLRGVSTHQAALLPITRTEERQLGWRAGGAFRVRVVSNVLRLVVNTFVLLLALMLLGLRPQVPAARIAALALAYWVGGNNLIAAPGFGALFRGFSPGAHAVVALVDLLYLAGCFALLIHFAAIFPQPLPLIRRRRAFETVPYLIVLPLAAVMILSALRYYSPMLAEIVPPLPLSPMLAVYGPLLLTLEASVLALQFRYTTDLQDRRRLGVVLISLLPGLLAWLIAIYAEASSWPPTARASASVLQWAGSGAGFGALAYALARHRLFGVRPVLRKSIQYAFARGTLILGMLLPAFVLALFLYERRQESLADLVTRDSAVPALILIVGIFIWRRRQTFLDGIDRRFFREDYDARHTLLRVVTMIQRGTDITVLGRVALLEIEKTLHPLHLSLWLLDSSELHFEALIWRGEEGATPTLQRSSAVIRLLGSRGQPLEVERPLQPALQRLAPEDQAWLDATGSALIVPLSVDREVMGFLLLGERMSEEPYTEDDNDLLMAIGGQLALTEDYGRLEILARKDPLTEALNRHAFYSLLEKKRSFPFQHGTSGSVAVVDIDDLKRINDTHGHGAGDLAIRHVASAIRGVVRADDLVFRWGGDEFLVVLFGLPSAEVKRRLDTIELLPIEWETKLLDVTVSFGVASFEEVNFVPAAIEEADRSMYASKLAQKQTRE